MAALTWRNVDLPNFDLRGLQVAGNGITDAFSRMGQMLIDREATLRNDATKAATAKLMMASSPEELAALQNTSGLDKRVDLSTYASMLDGRRDTLQQRALTQEDLLNKQAAAMFGDEHAAMLMAAAKGDQGEIDRVRLQAERDPLWGRVAGQFMDSVTKTLGETQTRMETATHNRAGEATQRVLASNDSRRVSIAEQQQRWAQQDRTRLENERKSESYGSQVGRGFVDNLIKQGITPDNAVGLVVRTPTYRNASATAKAAILKDAKARADELLQDTPLNTRSAAANTAENIVAQIGSNAKVFDTLVDNQLTRNNPGLAIAKAAQKPEYQTATIEDVLKRWERTDIANSAEYVNRLIAQGASFPELMAMPDVIDMSDRTFNSPLEILRGGLVGSAEGGAIGAAMTAPVGGAGGIPGAGIGFVGGLATNALDFTSGTRRADDAFNAMLELRKPGNLAKAEQNDANRRADSVALQARVANLQDQIKVQRQLTGTVPPALLFDLRIAQRKMEELVGSARGDTK